MGGVTKNWARARRKKEPTRMTQGKGLGGKKRTKPPKNTVRKRALAKVR